MTSPIPDYLICASLKITTPFGWFDVYNDDEVREFLNQHGAKFGLEWAADVARLNAGLKTADAADAVARYYKKYAGIMVCKDNPA